ncbi:MAG: 1-deoxy-D-xylulose-5-phosphate reductoisomerase [Coriobacteriia bacterium]|nr:1-deoxy-D-xylulose-5-phosphate reductoisomerase [Coriobacteriia bacterium]
MSRPLRVVVLGSTGSIGRQTLMIAARFPERIQIVALAAHSNAELLAAQARTFKVSRVALSDPAAAEHTRSLLDGLNATIDRGPQAVVELAALESADIILNALVGAAGLRSSIAALSAGKRLALANKESLVVGGELVMRLAEDAEMLPVDSEHSAIYQCLVGERPRDVERIWLTASGGPFRGRTRDQLTDVTVKQALAHPRWTMGPKITIDSATLMNKGLETIEAHHLFGVPYDKIRIVVHPQSCIHSMVEFSDGSVKAHLGATDMRIPIQYAFSHPERWEAPLPPVDFTQIGHLDFEDPDYGAFPCLGLALEAGRTAGTMPAVMNAANEIAVAAFLRHRAAFLDIPRVIETVMERHNVESLQSVEQIEEIDGWARKVAEELL